MDNTPTNPVFADRYRFETIGNDWDRGRSGFTGLVYDMKENRLGVIKRTETYSKQSTHSLQNEVKALKALRGLGVPEVYDANQAEYSSRKYDYAVIEYIDGIRVEKNLAILSIVERAEIITQLFQILSQAHQKGIVNGDVDLKHLFWRKDKKQLVVIDWGNARLGVDPKNKTEFAYDLARAAEIIFSLVTRQGHPPATGSIALPDASALVKGFGLFPGEFQELCRWAPRTPLEGAQSPYTAKELFEASRKWRNSIRTPIPYVPPPSKRILWLFGIPVLFCLLSLAMFFFTPNFQNLFIPLPSETLISLSSTSSPVLIDTASPTITPTETLTPTAIPTETPLIPTVTPTPFPSPLEYSPVVVFDDTYLSSEYKLCWTNKIDPLSDLVSPEGFNRKIDQTWWVFNTGEGRTNEESVMADFSTCPKGQSDGAVSLSKSVKSLALNTWITQIKPGSGNTPEGEFGLFLKAENGSTREYTLWVDENDKLRLRIRENAQIIYDDKVLVVNVQANGNIYNQFRIQIFLEMDNSGSAIIYLSEANSDPANVQDINPNQMIRVDAAVRPKMDMLQEFGLIGRGGSTQVLIWPLALLGK